MSRQENQASLSMTVASAVGSRLAVSVCLLTGSERFSGNRQGEHEWEGLLTDRVGTWKAT